MSFFYPEDVSLANSIRESRKNNDKNLLPNLLVGKTEQDSMNCPGIMI
jgi:hypothetical protein